MPKLNVDTRGLLHLGKLSKGYFLTTIINQAIPFLILPILTRFLSPTEYGTLALFTFYLTLTNALVGSSMQSVISKSFFKKEKKEIAVIVGNGVVIVGSISLIVFVLLLIIHPYAVEFLNLPLQWLLIIPPSSMAFVVFYMALSVMRNAKKVLTFGKFKVGNTIVDVSTSLILITILLWSWQGRAVGIIIAYFASAIAALIYLNKEGYLSFSITKDKIQSILKVLIPLIPNAFQAIIISRVGIFFMQYYYTKELLGLYTIGFQIAVMLQLLVATLAMSWGPYLYEELSNKKQINKLYLARLFYALSGILVIGALFINFTASFILRVMTTPEYYDAVEFLPWFAFGFVFFGFYTFLTPILIDGEQQKYISVVTLINVILMLIFNFWFVDLFGYIGIAYAFCLTYFLMFAAFFVKSQKVLPLPWLQALQIWK
ncbi:MAG: oligosaccharide flippase family protein [Salinivirgaceae bacterium]|jgi:O-antigen/teichoic acid export membrane protein|nr:oligosaccharide flippase family protein [Salinivirgaceae bacterium]